MSRGSFSKLQSTKFNTRCSHSTHLFLLLWRCDRMWNFATRTHSELNEYTAWTHWHTFFYWFIRSLFNMSYVECVFVCVNVCLSVCNCFDVYFHLFLSLCWWFCCIKSSGESFLCRLFVSKHCDFHCLSWNVIMVIRAEISDSRTSDGDSWNL